MSKQKSGYFDISPLIGPELATFPGDQPFSRQVALSFEQGDHLELSSVTTTLHLGAHADAECHYRSGGQGIEARSLNHYVGLCQVLAAEGRPAAARLGLEDVDVSQVKASRLLLRTKSFPRPQEWTDDFNSLSPELVEALAHKGVITVGIDTPSIDPSNSKDLPCHQQVFKHNMAILEGLVLKDVPEGLYILIAPPLKIQGADASPVRALLYPQNEDFQGL